MELNTSHFICFICTNMLMGLFLRSLTAPQQADLLPNKDFLIQGTFMHNANVNQTHKSATSRIKVWLSCKGWNSHKMAARTPTDAIDDRSPRRKWQSPTRYARLHSKLTPLSNAGRSPTHLMVFGTHSEVNLTHMHGNRLKNQCGMEVRTHPREAHRRPAWQWRRSQHLPGFGSTPGCAFDRKEQ